MIEIFGLIFPLFGLIALGYMAGRISEQPVEALGWLNTFIIYFALPALFYRLLSVTPIHQLARWEFIGANIATTIGIFTLTVILGLIATRGRLADATIQGLAGAYGNIGYMGPALAIIAFGEAAAVPVAIIFCFENVVHFSTTPALMALSGERQQRPFQLIASVIRAILFHPFILATLAGVTAAYFQAIPPIPIAKLIDYLSQAAAPCALFAMGVTLALRPLNRVPWALGYIVPMKLLIHPLAMYVVLSWVGDFDRIWTFTAVLLAALPTATNVFVMAQQYDVWVERASASILITTTLSVITVSLLLFLMSTGAIPADLFPST